MYQHSCFNTQPPEGGWFSISSRMARSGRFQHTAARRRLGSFIAIPFYIRGCFNTQPPEGGWVRWLMLCIRARKFQHTAARRRLVPVSLANVCHLGFNTQPPEGGWDVGRNLLLDVQGFNTQPPEGGWPYLNNEVWMYNGFQHTAARRRLGINSKFNGTRRTSFNTQPPEGGWLPQSRRRWFCSVSTHSRPKAAGRINLFCNR